MLAAMLRRGDARSRPLNRSHRLANARSAANAALQKILTKRPRAFAALATLDKFDAEIHTSKDARGMVLVSVAIIEQLLEDAILAHCVRQFDKELRGRLFGGDNDGATIQGFYGKIWLGRALGIYGQAFQEDLDRFRRIRNVFAHAKVPLTFKSKAIIEACEFHVFDDRLRAMATLRPKDPRKRFLEALSLLSIVLFTLAAQGRRFRPRAKPNGTWVYASPAPSPQKPKSPSRRHRQRGDQSQLLH